MAKKPKSFYKVHVQETLHNFRKLNLVTKFDKTSQYDEMKCVNCGVTGKKRSFTHVDLEGYDEKIVFGCDGRKPIHAQKVRVTNCTGVGRAFANLTSGTIHRVIEPPSDHKLSHPNTDYSVWVQGVGRTRAFTGFGV